MRRSYTMTVLITSRSNVTAAEAIYGGIYEQL